MLHADQLLVCPELPARTAFCQELLMPACAYWLLPQVGILQVVVIALGAMFPPFVLLTLMNLCCIAFKHCQSRKAHCKASGPETVSEPDLGRIDLELLPGYRLACSTEVQGRVELQMGRGRANCRTLLRLVRMQHEHLPQVDVLVGGEWAERVCFRA